MEFKRDGNLIYLGDVKDPDAYIGFSIKDGVMSLDTTVVKPKLGGQGIAAKITDEALEYAKEEGYKVRPVCSYAVRYFEKHPELENLMDK